MTEQEQADLAAMLAECNRIRKNTFGAMRDYDRWTPEQVKTSGYKTKEDAMIEQFRYAQKQIDKLLAAHVRKYPD